MQSKEMKKKFMKVIIVACTIVSFIGKVNAGEWIQDSGYWSYTEDGELVVDKQKAIDGIWYMFDQNGHLVTGLYEREDKFYSFKSDGTPAEGVIEYGGKKYNVSNKGEIKGINQDDFYGYQDSLSALYIVGGGFDSDLSDMLKLGLQQAKEYFKTLPLSRKAFKKIFKLKSYNDDAIKYMLSNADVNWKQQALSCAKEFYDKAQLSRIDMKNLLIAEGFSEIEASYGTEMAFMNDSLSSGTGKIDSHILLRDYLDKMSQVIIGQKISDIEESKKKEEEQNREISKQNKELEKIAKANGYVIKNKNKRTYQLNLTDDDMEKGKVRMKITLPVPELEGANADVINKLISDNVFVEVEKYLEYNYYDEIRRELKYVAGSVELSSTTIDNLVLTFKGKYDVKLVIDLNAFIFKRDIIK